MQQMHPLTLKLTLLNNEAACPHNASKEKKWDRVVHSSAWVGPRVSDEVDVIDAQTAGKSWRTTLRRLHFRHGQILYRL